MFIKKLVYSVAASGLVATTLVSPFCKAEGQSVNVSAKAACLIILDSGEVIFSKNEHDKMPMASTTKIMTALLTLEFLDAFGNKDIEITDDMVRVEGTSMGLMPGDVVNLDTLAKGMLLPSGNDAANTASIAVSGDKDKFVSLMNERAKQIGMKNTNFVTPSGLDSGDHHSTAYDMAILGSVAMENDKFLSIVSKKSEKVMFIKPEKTVFLRNHNKLLRLYDGCMGIKTGFTKSAGRCLVSCAQKNGVKLVAVTLNAPNDWDDHKTMFDYGFECTESADFDDSTLKTSIPVNNGEKNYADCFCSSAFSCSFKKGNSKKVKRVAEIPENVNAPIEKGQILGKVVYYLDGKEIGHNDLLSGDYVGKIKQDTNLWKRVCNFFSSIFKWG